jgi:hypothetical protein
MNHAIHQRATARVMAVARRSGEGVPVVLLARIDANDEADDDDPYLDLGEGD